MGKREGERQALQVLAWRAAPPGHCWPLFVAGHPDLSHCLLWPTRVASVVTAPDCAPTPLSARAAALRTHVREKEGAAGDGEAWVPGAACLWPGEGQQVILVWSQATQVAEGRLQGCKCGGWESQARRPGCWGSGKTRSVTRFAAAQKAPPWRGPSLPGCLLEHGEPPDLHFPSPRLRRRASWLCDDP